MTIIQYLDDSEFATRKLLEAVWNDFEKAEQLTDEIKVQTEIVNTEYDRSLAMQIYAEDADDLMLGVGRYWENHFGAAKELYNKDQKLLDLTALLAAREMSLSQLCGALLDQAKRGLSLTFGKPSNWPSGRLIGSQAISKVIVAARNQSAHIDEALRNGQYKNADIMNCFTTINAENNDVVRDFLSRDMSFEIVKLLGWTSYDRFRSDVEGIQ